ncbi:galactokinase [Flavihumibacter solisilvae]|nr:galactokinase [Flavihumibacter solisilvae]
MPGLFLGGEKWFYFKVMITVNMSKYSGQLHRLFLKHFGTEPVMFRSPGRVNLIGEHTDYNQGFVLPAAIDKATYIAIAPRMDDQVNIVSADLEQQYHFSLQDVGKSGLHWPDYIIGVVQQLLALGSPIHGFDIAFGGNVPIGAGMSSSAALECATAFALNRIFDCGLSSLEMVKAAQRAENQFVGVNCGIMDQFASMFGKDGHVIRLDCRSLDYTYIPFRMEGYRVALLDTGIRHNLSDTEYNTRRMQCESGVALIQMRYPEVQSLRDVTMQMLNDCIRPGNEIIYKRCKYVVEENIRLMQACSDLEENDIRSFGERMYSTHEGLAKLYEVSCPELDILVEETRLLDYVPGSRMMGGGFGGCTINLVREDHVDELVKTVGERYKKQTGKNMSAHIVTIGNGTSAVNNPFSD